MLRARGVDPPAEREEAVVEELGGVGDDLVELGLEVVVLRAAKAGAGWVVWGWRRAGEVALACAVEATVLQDLRRGGCAYAEDSIDED